MAKKPVPPVTIDQIEIKRKDRLSLETKLDRLAELNQISKAVAAEADQIKADLAAEMTSYGIEGKLIHGQHTFRVLDSYNTGVSKGKALISMLNHSIAPGVASEIIAEATWTTPYTTVVVEVIKS